MRKVVRHSPIDGHHPLKVACHAVYVVRQTAYVVRRPLKVPRRPAHVVVRNPDKSS